MLQGIFVVGSVLFLTLGLFGYLGRLRMRSGGSVGPFRNSIYGGAWPVLMPRAKPLTIIRVALALAAMVHALVD